ncbi:hypothetical protein HN011_004201 [Eciton burchellii]|nr:hypothetical protein HN011_004201 [Eciton burchellii]
MEPLTINEVDVQAKIQQKDDSVFVENTTSSHMSCDTRKTRSNSVIDSIGGADSIMPSADNMTLRNNSLSTLDYHTSPDQDCCSISSKVTDVETSISDCGEKISDISDAYASFRPQNVAENNNLIAGLSLTTTALMPVLKDAECYNMNHKNRGKCVIFNHEEFETGFDKREGSTTDALRLEKSFGKLGFDVEVHNDFTHVEVMSEIDKLSHFDHKDNDCLCIIVLTHGLHNDFICAKDAAFKSDKIWKSFTAEKCKSLAGKPKLFFFQACRGDELDGGVLLCPRSLITSETDSVASYKIPTHADFLIAHSSVQGFYTWRNPVEGTWYIQCLCDILDEYGTKLDLMTLLTMTARKVATDYTSNNIDDPIMHDKKQVPSVTTMLIRSVYFPPKSNVYIAAETSINDL